MTAELVTAWLSGLSVLIGVLATSGVAGFVALKRWRAENAAQNAAILAAQQKAKEDAEGARVASEARNAERKAGTDELLALGTDIRAKVDGNLEKVTDKLDVANAKIDELHVKVEAQAHLMTPPVVAVITPPAKPTKGAK